MPNFNVLFLVCCDTKPFIVENYETRYDVNNHLVFSIFRLIYFVFAVFCLAHNSLYWASLLFFLSIIIKIYWLLMFHHSANMTIEPDFIFCNLWLDFLDCVNNPLFNRKTNKTKLLRFRRLEKKNAKFRFVLHKYFSKIYN